MRKFLDLDKSFAPFSYLHLYLCHKIQSANSVEIRLSLLEKSVKTYENKQLASEEKEGLDWLVFQVIK